MRPFINLAELNLPEGFTGLVVIGVPYTAHGGAVLALARAECLTRFLGKEAAMAPGAFSFFAFMRNLIQGNTKAGTCPQAVCAVFGAGTG